MKFSLNAPFDGSYFIGKTINATTAWRGMTMLLLFQMNGTTHVIPNVYYQSIRSSQAPKVIFDRNSQDVYSDPGIWNQKTEYNRYVLAIENDNAYYLAMVLLKRSISIYQANLILTLQAKRLYTSSLHR
jgi:hypothetical protein